MIILVEVTIVTPSVAIVPTIEPRKGPAGDRSPDVMLFAWTLAGTASISPTTNIFAFILINGISVIGIVAPLRPRITEAAQDVGAG